MKTGFTLGMFVTLQDSCNLNCKFCQFPNKPEFRSGRRIDKDKFLGMIDCLKIQPPPVPVYAICFCGSAEPLLYSDLTEIIRETRKVIPYISIVTNGILLTPQMSEELIAADIAHIVVSVTGNSEDVYSEFQGSNFERDKSDRLFYKVRENIKSFTKIRDSKKSKTQIGISYILTEDTKKDLVPAMRFYNDINVNYVDVRMQSGGYVADKTTFEDYLDTVVKPGDGIACTCYGKVMNLTTDGALSFCNCPEKQNIIGNVFETPITDIIGSERFLKLLDAFHGEYENIPEICKVCDIGRARPILA